MNAFYDTLDRAFHPAGHEELDALYRQISPFPGSTWYRKALACFLEQSIIIGMGSFTPRPPKNFLYGYKEFFESQSHKIEEVSAILTHDIMDTLVVEFDMYNPAHMAQLRRKSSICSWYYYNMFLSIGEAVVANPYDITMHPLYDDSFIPRLRLLNDTVSPPAYIKVNINEITHMFKISSDQMVLAKNLHIPHVHNVNYNIITQIYHPEDGLPRRPPHPVANSCP